MSKFLEIPSSNGWQKITFEIIQIFRYKGEDLYLTRLEFKADFWDRKKSLIEGLDDADLIVDKGVVLEQVIIRKEALGEVLNSLQAVEEESPTLLVSLGVETEPNLTLYFGDTDDLIVERTKSVVELRYEDVTFRFRWRLKVDPTCVEIFRNGIQQLLET